MRDVPVQRHSIGDAMTLAVDGSFSPYWTRPVEIGAFQYQGNHDIGISTERGYEVVRQGDWICKREDGSLYVVEADRFEQHYKPLEEAS